MNIKEQLQSAIDYCNAKLSAKGVAEQATSVVDIGNKIESIQSISSGVMNNLTFDFSGSDISVKEIRKLFENIPTLQSITFTDVVIDRNNFLKYTLLDYIQSTGTQYIDTLCLCDSTLYTFEMLFSQVGTSFDEHYFGVDTNPSTLFGLYNGKFRFVATNFSNYKGEYNCGSNFGYNKMTMGKSCKFNGYVLWDNNIKFQHDENAYIFGSNKGGSRVGGSTKIKLYSFVIHDAATNNIIKYLLPVLDNNGTACLYDIIGDQLYYNQGTGYFITSPIVIGSNEINNGVVKINLSQSSINNKIINDLFATYQEVEQINFKDTQLTREEFYNYTEIEYLESTGTQWIDTDIVPINREVIATYQYTKANNDTAIFGGNVSSGEPRYHLTWYNNKWYYACGGSEANTIDSDKNFICTNKQTVDFNNSNNAIVWNDENGNTYSVTVNTNGATAGTQTLKIFGRANTSNLSLAKLYSFKIIDKETQQVVRNFISAIDVLGTPCLYDTVTEKYYYNKGTGEFLSGPIVIGSNEINNGVVEVNLSQSYVNNKIINDLFAKYQEVEQINFKDAQLTREKFYNYTKIDCLKTTKTQFLDTKIKYNDNYKIGIDFLVEDTDVNDSVICGSRDWEENRNIVTIESGYVLRNHYPSNSVNYSFGQNQRKQIEIFRGQIIYDNTVQVGNDNINPSVLTNTANIHIFSDNNGEHLINYAKLYGFYIYDTTTNSYIMNAFPALDSNGTPCLYDTITKKYYYNQGTGEFLFE